MEDFSERPAVSAFLLLELGSFKVTKTTVRADLRREDSRVYTQFRAVREQWRVKDILISIWDPTVVS